MKKLSVFLVFYFISFVLFAQSDSNDERAIINSMIDIIGKVIPNDAIRYTSEAYIKETTRYITGTDSSTGIDNSLSARYMYGTIDGSTIDWIAYIVTDDTDEENFIKELVIHFISLSFHTTIRGLNGVRESGNRYTYRGYFLGVGYNIERNEVWITVRRN